MNSATLLAPAESSQPSNRPEPEAAGIVRERDLALANAFNWLLVLGFPADIAAEAVSRVALRH